MLMIFFFFFFPFFFGGGVDLFYPDNTQSICQTFDHFFLSEKLRARKLFRILLVLFSQVGILSPRIPDMLSLCWSIHSIWEFTPLQTSLHHGWIALGRADASLPGGIIHFPALFTHWFYFCLLAAYWQAFSFPRQSQQLLLTGKHSRPLTLPFHLLKNVLYGWIPYSRCHLNWRIGFGSVVQRLKYFL